MATLGTVTLETDVNLRGLDKGLKQAKGHTKSFLTNVKEGFAKQFGFSAADAAMKAAKAVKQFADESIAEFQTFEKQVNEVFTLMPGISSAAMEAMKADALSFGAAVGRNSDEVLPALYQAISAGVPQENVFDFMQIASDAALGGVTDLQTAVDGITSATNAYGIENLSAAEASNVMFTAVRLGKTDFAQLSGSLFNVIPTAASLGVTFEDVAANLAALTAQGTPTSVATTQMRAAFVEASKSGSKLDKALRQLSGVGFADLIARGQTSSEVFLTLRNSMPEQEFRDLFSSVEASNAVLGITSETALGVIDDFVVMGDATEQAAATMAESMEHLEARAAAATEAFKIQAGAGLSPLKKGYLEAKIALFDYATANHALNAALADGTITSGELNRMQFQMTFTSKTAADVMAELAVATSDSSNAHAENATSIEAQTAAQIASTVAQREALAADEAATQAIVEYSAAQAEARGPNEELNDKIAQQGAQLSETEAFIASANAASGEYTVTLDGLSIAQQKAALFGSMANAAIAGHIPLATQQLGLTQQLNAAIAAIHNQPNTFLFDVQVKGMTQLQSAASILKGIRDFGAVDFDPFGGSDAGPTGAAVGDAFDPNFAHGGFTGGVKDRIAGKVHGQELVVPTRVLRSGPAAILDFANENVPSGMMGGGGSSSGGGGASGGAASPLTIDLRGAVIMSQEQANQIIQTALDASGIRADIYMRTE